MTSMTDSAGRFSSLSDWVDRLDVETSNHLVQFYDSDEFLLEHLTRFVGSALGSGDAAVVIATRIHRDGLEERLRANGISVDEAKATGRFTSIDADEMLPSFMRGDMPDDIRFLDAVSAVLDRARHSTGDKNRRIAVFGELVALLYADNKGEAAIRLEEIWNDLLGTYPFRLLCAYPTSSFPTEQDSDPLRLICANHDHVIPSESYVTLTDESERLREIAVLQQRARALQIEVERREAVEKALQQRNKELNRAVAVRDEFLSIAAHELKTPVTGVRGFVHLMLRDIRSRGAVAPERLKVALDAIDSQTAKLNQVIARLMEASEVRAGLCRIECRRTNFVDLIHASIVSQPSSDAHVISYRGPDEYWVWIDPVRIGHVIDYVLENAVKFSPDGGEIHVDLEPLAEDVVHLSVTDSGIGVPPEKRPWIFDPYHRNGDQTHLSGMGLSLYLAREFVRLHGGTIALESSGVGGSRFLVTLPAGITDASERGLVPDHP